MRNFFHPLPSWRFDRVEGGRRIYRSIEDLGPGVIKINDGLWFVIGRRGVKEYDGRFLRRVVIISASSAR